MHSGRGRPPRRAASKSREENSRFSLLNEILSKLRKKDKFQFFHQPVDAKLVPDYHKVIEYPMDFSTMEQKIAVSAASRPYNFEEFEADLNLIVSNCQTYNAPDTPFWKQASVLFQWWQKSRESFESRFSKLQSEDQSSLIATPIEDAAESSTDTPTPAALPPPISSPPSPQDFFCARRSHGSNDAVQPPKRTSASMMTRTPMPQPLPDPATMHFASRSWEQDWHYLAPSGPLCQDTEIPGPRLTQLWKSSGGPIRVLASVWRAGTEPESPFFRLVRSLAEVSPAPVFSNVRCSIGDLAIETTKGNLSNVESAEDFTPAEFRHLVDCKRRRVGQS